MTKRNVKISTPGRDIFPDRLEKARIDKGYTRPALARLVGCPTQTIQKIEDGLSRTSSYLTLIARALDIHEDWLTGLVDDPIPPASHNPFRRKINDLLEKIPDDDLPKLHDIIQTVFDLSVKRRM
ncbi:XRE family transcriptional regulator [Azospirillum cavernae]|uniref:XRE family transcriptional regulator n=1 Tax=Azospirillum cavernae TaxID=2320860 RepID=A0A418VYX4_9PROT|nr:helix-turn-helix transcriptional regulator [Azospirillum cavernae]RJF82310.1 XRE family transcriptional regulator [Azospirillum cavernae]